MTVQSVTTRISPEPGVAVFSPAGTVVAREGISTAAPATGVQAVFSVPTVRAAPTVTVGPPAGTQATGAVFRLPGVRARDGALDLTPGQVPVGVPPAPPAAAGPALVGAPFGPAAAGPAAGVPVQPALETFTNPINQLAALNPVAALAAVSPTAAVTALSPALRFLNPAVNPVAALLAFNPEAAPALAIANPAAAAMALTPLAAVSPFFAGFQAPFAI